MLWEDGDLAPDQQARFHTRSGLLLAERARRLDRNGFSRQGEQAAGAPDGLAAALGIQPVYVGRNQFDYLVEVDSAAAVRAIQPQHATLRKLPVRGVIVTARSDTPEFDFVSRFFAPGSGIDEDPVTGSAHCCLGPYWSKRTGKTELVAFQASPRGGVVRVRCWAIAYISAGRRSPCCAANWSKEKRQRYRYSGPGGNVGAMAAFSAH